MYGTFAQTQEQEEKQQGIGSFVKNIFGGGGGDSSQKDEGSEETSHKESSKASKSETTTKSEVRILFCKEVRSSTDAAFSIRS